MDGGKVDGKRLLKARSAKQMQSPVVEAGDFHRHYAVGWCVHDFPEFRTLSHGGATRGFRANLTVLPDRGFAIAILTNGEAGSRAIQEIEAWALHHLLGLARPVPPRTTLQPQALASFAGTWERHDGHYTVTVVDDRLDIRVVSIHEETGEVEDDQVYPLVPVADTRFRVPDGPNKGASIDFITWQGGGVTREFLRMGGRLAERSSGQTGNGAADEKKRVKGKAKRKGKKQ
jgi:hypothetical protein